MGSIGTEETVRSLGRTKRVIFGGAQSGNVLSTCVRRTCVQGEKKRASTKDRQMACLKGKMTKDMGRVKKGSTKKNESKCRNNTHNTDRCGFE